MPLQIPPAVGSSGQFVETAIVTSSQQRHVMVVGDGVSTAYAPVTSSAGALVSVSSGTFTLSSAPTVISSATTITSGTVTVSNPTTAVNVVGTVPIVSASSGLVQIAGTPTVVSASSGVIQLSSAPLVIAASSAGHQVGSLTSGIVSPSSNWTVVLSSIPSLSSGTVTLSSAPLVIVATSGGTIPVTLSTVFSLSSVPTVTATAATNPWSSAPSFNMPVVNASSGIVQAIVTGSSGVGALVSSGGSLQVITTASASGSTAVNVLGTQNAIVSVATSGAFTGALVTWSHVAGSSGVTAVVTSSGALLVSGTPGSVSTAVNILASGGTIWGMTTQTAAMRVDPVGSYNQTGAYRVGTSYILGTTPARMNLVSIYCTTSQSANIAVKRINCQMNMTTSAAVAFMGLGQYIVGRASSSGAPTGGTVLTQQKRRTADAASIAVVRSTPTTTMAAGLMWADNPGQLVTAVGHFYVAPLIFGAEGREDDDVILAPGEALLVVTDLNSSTVRHSIDLSWVEFTT